MRIELDDMQALAFEACSENAKTKVAMAAERAAQANKALAEAKRVRASAVTAMEAYWQAVAACHGLEAIPEDAEITRVDGRILVEWTEATTPDTAAPNPGDSGATQPACAEALAGS